jgi:Ni,Fe-hydrogenase maturation factor
VLCLVLIVRAYNLTVSKISYDRWKSLIPFKSRRDVVNGYKTLRGYMFIKPHETPIYFGHNPLQQLTYTGVYLILCCRSSPGSRSGASTTPTHSSSAGSAGSTSWIGTPQVRLLHYMIMWGLLIFIPAHVYLSVRADSVERTGAISSMVSGGRWVRRGAVFEDWPNPDGGNAPVGSEFERDPAHRRDSFGQAPMSTVVIGLGNPLLTDDGVGIVLLEALRETAGSTSRWSTGAPGDSRCYRCSPTATACSCWTRCKAGNEPGTVVRGRGADVPRLYRYPLVPHQIDLTEVLAAAEMVGGLPADMEVIGVEPGSTDGPCLTLTDPVAAALPRAADEARRVLLAWGHTRASVPSTSATGPSGG